MSEELVADSVRAVVDPTRGARLTSLSFDGLEVLGAAGAAGTDPSIGVGCYPMVPWAGRIGGGVIHHDSRSVQLPTEPEGNALHGTGRDVTWTSLGDGRFSTRLVSGWPEPGDAELRYTVRPDGLDLTLTWRPDRDTGLGCALGFHPWFVRTLRGAAVDLDVRPDRMVERDDRLPTGALVDPARPPWDDCFTLLQDPVVAWPGQLALRLTSDAPWWVVYSGDPGGVCVEPQTVPPDSWAHPQLAPERPDSLTFSITRA